jgi:hypothetical protein
VSPRVSRPTGTVMFLLKDMEGSARQWQADPSVIGALAASHDQLVRQPLGVPRERLVAVGSPDLPAEDDLAGVAATAAAFLSWYRAGGERSQGDRLMRRAQDAAEAEGAHIGAAHAAGNIVLAAIRWDCVDAPEVARAINDGCLSSNA